MRDFRLLLVGLLLGFGLIATGLAVGDNEKTEVRYLITPDCPTEDSCNIDYRDGVWYVIP